MARARAVGSISSDCRQAFDDSWLSERPASSKAENHKGAVVQRRIQNISQSISQDVNAAGV
jgi:hypothetical protein